jgi:hypothetical protein
MATQLLHKHVIKGTMNIEKVIYTDLQNTWHVLVKSVVYSRFCIVLHAFDVHVLYLSCWMDETTGMQHDVSAQGLKNNFFKKE